MACYLLLHVRCVQVWLYARLRFERKWSSRPDRYCTFGWQFHLNQVPARGGLHNWGKSSPLDSFVYIPLLSYQRPSFSSILLHSSLCLPPSRFNFLFSLCLDVRERGHARGQYLNTTAHVDST